MAELRLEQGVLRLQTSGGSDVQRVPLQDGDVARFQRWAAEYEAAVPRDDEAALLALCRDIHAWLDARSLQSLGEDERDIRFATPLRPDADERAFLAVPWELLADRDGFWALDVVTPYHPARLLGRAGSPAVPPHQDVQLLFMAAQPLNQTELDYEAEEAGILGAVKGQPVRLVVEESGALAPLRDRVAQGAPWEALHLSCHGDVDDELGPVLALETDLGDDDLVTTGQLLEALGDVRPLLVFLSACHTAERVGASAPLALELARGRVPNVLGWDGSVNDGDAIAFSRELYGELGRRRSVPAAAAAARRALLRLPRDEGGHHWHLARLYLSAAGDGPLLNPDGKRRDPPPVGAQQAMLDRRRHQVPVASAEVFVGRRRETQAVLRAFGSDPQHAGVLLHGMGRLGKSSLAARVGSRMPRHHVAVVYGRQPGEYDAAAVFTAVVEALPPGAREPLRERWMPAISRQPRQLFDALQAVLQGPHPVLLVVDNLERILETPAPGQQRTPVREAQRGMLRDVLRAFDGLRRDHASRLLLTSRYEFTLPGDDGQELATRLLPLQLPPMTGDQRHKLLKAEARVAPAPLVPLDEAQAQRSAGLLERATAASAGNPGLLSLLARAARQASTLDQAEAALEAVEGWRERGDAPVQGDLGQFFVELALDTYRQALTADETAQMRAALVFEGLPVPWHVMEAAGRAAGVDDPQQAIHRLTGLGCLDAFQTPGAAAQGARPELAANALAGPLFEALGDEARRRVAGEVGRLLYEAWVADDEGYLPLDARALLVFELTVDAAVDGEVINASAVSTAAFWWQIRSDARATLSVVNRAMAVLDQSCMPANLHLIRMGAEAASRLGDSEREAALLSHGQSREDGNERAWAMLRGAHADWLERMGELTEALRIRREEQLPVYDKLGDVRSRALTMGKIAYVLQLQGELEEALRIHIEERLPVAHQMQDIDLIAHIRYCCASIRLEKGWESEQALATVKEELGEAFGISVKLERVDAIAAIGAKFGSLLLQIGDASDASMVLELAVGAARKIGKNQLAAQLEPLLAQARAEAEAAGQQGAAE